MNDTAQALKTLGLFYFGGMLSLMKRLLILSLMFASPSFAALSIKPGLWTIETKMKKDGKEYDPQAKMKEAMAKMSPEQKKQMEQMMAKMSAKMGHPSNPNAASAFGMSEKGMQVCFSGKTLQNEEFLNQHKQHDCTNNFTTKSSTRVVMEFKCKNGSNGTAEWNVKDSTHYQGAVKMTNSKGDKSEINYLGTFTSADCGKVKPIDEVIAPSAKK